MNVSWRWWFMVLFIWLKIMKAYIITKLLQYQRLRTWDCSVKHVRNSKGYLKSNLVQSLNLKLLSINYILHAHAHHMETKLSFLGQRSFKHYKFGLHVGHLQRRSHHTPKDFTSWASLIKYIKIYPWTQLCL